MEVQFKILAIIIYQSDTNYTFTGQTSVVVNDRIYNIHKVQQRLLYNSMETLTEAILAGSDLLPFIYTGHHLSHCISYLLLYVNHRCEYYAIYYRHNLFIAAVMTSLIHL